MDQAATIDVPTTIFVLLAFLTSVAATFFAWKFARTVGGDMGAAFRWVQVGVIIFAITRADDFMKTSSLFTQMGVDYDKTMLLPHHLATFLSWILIGVGFYKMDKAFST
jgi:hypothetical protein